MSEPLPKLRRWIGGLAAGTLATAVVGYRFADDTTPGIRCYFALGVSGFLLLVAAIAFLQLIGVKSIGREGIEYTEPGSKPPPRLARKPPEARR